MWYKKDGDNLLKANEVHNASYKIDADTDKTQEIEGWKWFEEEDQAYAHFGVTKPVVEESEKERKRKTRLHEKH